MQTVLRRFSILSYVLILQLTGLPQTALAQIAGPAKAQARQSPLKIAVLEIHDGRLKPEVIEKVTDTLRDELSRQEKLEVLSKETTQRYLNSTSTLRAADAANPLDRYLDQAKEFYKTMNFKEAIAVLENTIQTYRQSTTAQSELFSLTDAYLMLGNIQMGNNNPKAAASAFQEASRTDPSRQITEMEYPPKTVRAFQEARENFLKKAKQGSLEIHSSPGKAEVYVNGNPKGLTPLNLAPFTVGDHFVLIKTAGYRSQGKKIRLEEGEVREKFSLEKIAAPSPAARGGLTVNSLKDVPAQVRLVAPLGKSMGVDKVVLVSVEEVGWNSRITARMVDMKYQASHKHQSVDVLDLPKDTRSAIQVIASDLSQMADIDLAKNPKKYADSEVIVIGTKKKKSFLKSPILWGIVGVLVAGGAATAFLVGRGGGGDSGGSNTSTVGVSGAIGKTP